MTRYKLALRYIKRHKFSPDEKRNFRLGGILSLYGLSFSVEKWFLGLGNPISDIYWAIIYGAFAVLATWWWLEDYLLDVWENHTTEDDELYAQQSQLTE